MTRLELRLEHYVAIRNFMDEVELEPPDVMSTGEKEALAVVKQIIVNIEKRRAQPQAERLKYRRGKAA